MKVVILYYVGKKEDDVDTLEGVKGIEEACHRLTYRVTTVNVTAENWCRAVETPGDIYFNFVEDETWDLYVSVGLGLEKLRKTQVAHDLASFKFATEKTAIKQVLLKSKLSTPNFKTFSNNCKINDEGLNYPLILKPSHQHAGIGISQKSVVTGKKDLEARAGYLYKRFGGDIIVEEYIAGREIHATVLGNGCDLTVFPLCEIGFGGKFRSGWSVYTYESKWDKKSWEYRDARVDAPAKIPENQRGKINHLAIKAYQIFGCRDIARFDVRVSAGGEPFLIDVNFNPSLNVYDEQDATVASVKACGWSYDEFIKKLLEITGRRAQAQKSV